MPKTRLIRHIVPLATTLSLIVLLGGCMVRPTQPLGTVHTRSVVLQQPAQVVYRQPVYRQPVVVQRPATIVYRTAPVVYRTAPVVIRQASSVMTPVRMSVPAQVYNRNIGSQCVPGTSRQCYAYCGYGVQHCNGNGTGWGSCIEGRY